MYHYVITVLAVAPMRRTFQSRSSCRRGQPSTVSAGRASRLWRGSTHSPTTWWSKRDTTSFDDSLLLAATLERVLREGTDAARATTPPLAELPGLIVVAGRVEDSAHTVTPSDSRAGTSAA